MPCLTRGYHHHFTQERLRAGGRGLTGRLDGITDSMDMSLSRLQERAKDREACCATVHRVPKSRTSLSN